MKRYFNMLLSLMAGVILLVTFSHAVYALEIGARAYYWSSTFKTDTKVDGASSMGTDLNLKNDVGVGHEYYPSVEIYGGLGKHHLSLIYTQADYSGSNTL